MPDFTYHPFFKPLLFRMSGEAARAITTGLLAMRAKTAAGRLLFRAFARAEPPEAALVRAFGLRFPSAVGLGIDIDGAAAPVMQHLGFGYLCFGPASVDAVAAREATSPFRVEERHAIVSSDRAGAPSVESIVARRRARPEIRVPIAIALQSSSDPSALADAMLRGVGAATAPT